MDPLKKAALVLSVLDEHLAQALLEQLQPQEAELVRRELGALDSVSPQERQAVLEQFVLGCRRAQQEQRSTQSFAKAPPGSGGVADSLGSRAGVSLELQNSPRPTSTTGSASPSLNTLNQVEPQRLAQALQQERAQTVALVLAHLQPAHAAQVLAHFSPRLQAEVLRRMARLEHIDPEVLQAVEQGLCQRLEAQVGVSPPSLRGTDLVAQVLHAAPRQVEQQLLENLDRYHPQLAQQFPRRKLEFDHLAWLPAAWGAVIVEQVGVEVLGLALLDTAPALQDRFRLWLSPQQRKQIEALWEDPGPLPLEDIAGAKRRIVEAALELERVGKIRLDQLPKLQAA